MLQSTHPRGVRQAQRRIMAHDQRVSIHAPARGATAETTSMYYQEGVSIHAPARGATGAGGSSTGNSAGFNPRTREGCDP